MDERNKVIEWKDTPAGIKVKGEFREWLTDHYPDYQEYPVGLEIIAGRWCEFFESSYSRLYAELSESDIRQVSGIWKTQAQITESAWLYNLMRMAF